MFLFGYASALSLIALIFRVFFLDFSYLVLDIIKVSIMTPIVLRSVISSSFIVRPLYNAMHCRAIGIIKKWQSRQCAHYNVIESLGMILSVLTIKCSYSNDLDPCL